MAYANGFDSLSDHSTRSRDSFSSMSRDNSLFSFFGEEPATSLSRPTSFGLPTPTSSFGDARGSLQRRFTINNAAPNVFAGMTSLSQQRRQGREFSPPDFSFAIKSHQGQRADRKSAERDYLRQKQLQFESAQNEIDQLELQIQRRKEQLRREQAEIGHNGHQSEPTTPPEYRDGGFPTSLSRPNRFSTSTLTSPPGLTNRPSRAGSQVVLQPASERARAYHALTGQSLPPTRDNSDEGEDDLSDGVWDFNHRSAAALNRNSMPVTRRDRNGVEYSSAIGPVNTTAFLFGDDHDPAAAADQSAKHSNRSSAVRGGFLQMNTNDDKFPVLIRRETDGKLQLPAASNALDLASSDSLDQDKASNGWSSFSQRSHRSSSQQQQQQQQQNHHQQQQQQPGASMSRNSITLTGATSPPQGAAQPLPNLDHTPTKANRNSLGQQRNGGPPKLQSSYSTSDIPTVKSTNPPPHYGQQNVTTAEERLHNHNASLGRIPRGAIGSNRASRDFNKDMTQSPEPRHEEPIPSMQTVLQSTPSTFGAVSQTPPATAVSAADAMPPGLASPTSFAANQPPASNSNPGFYGGYGVQSPTASSATSMSPIAATTAAAGSGGILGLNAMMGNMNLGLGGGVQGQWHNPTAPFMNNGPPPPPPPPAFGAPFGSAMYQQFAVPGQQGRYMDSQARVMQQRRNQNGEDNARFANVALENLQGEIYGLCKDQHGCRYLQKKLEEGKPEQTQLIFDETKGHMVDLMTDPFGNYLCQKLLEQTTDDQRTMLISNAAPHMVRIALNQHGTRALQKMIEYVSTPQQVQMVMVALRDQVVPMIQDLNGNHVIQKCLNRLSSDDAQFIFDAVASHCVVVGTHRHGCCVIQRCIDHASGNQKAQLVAAITASSFPLVQDPFGNYVLQYIFDQGEESFSQPLCRTFLGAIAMLSKQKFSSNVIEKCIRIAGTALKHEMIEEIIESPEFERLADDAFANYVVQTAWDYATPDDEERLADKIRPVLARMRHKPYGRRFQSRLAERDARLGITPPAAGAGAGAGASVPASAEATPSFANASMHRSQPSTDSSFYQSPPGSSHGVQITTPAPFAPPGGYGSNVAGFLAQNRRVSNPPFMGNVAGHQAPAQQPYGGYSNATGHGTGSVINSPINGNGLGNSGSGSGNGANQQQQGHRINFY